MVGKVIQGFLAAIDGDGCGKDKTDENQRDVLPARVFLLQILLRAWLSAHHPHHFTCPGASDFADTDFFAPVFRLKHGHAEHSNQRNDHEYHADEIEPLEKAQFIIVGLFKLLVIRHERPGFFVKVLMQDGIGLLPHVIKVGILIDAQEEIEHPNGFFRCDEREGLIAL